MRILLWHVHGSWTTAFVQGRHEYLIPVLPDRGAWGRGRADTWNWPESAIEVDPAHAAEADIDAVILQRPEELAGLAERWMGGRRPGRDVAAIYLEHSAPQGRVEEEMRHPAADRPDLTLVHVTDFNALFWDAGTTPTRAIVNGIVDPGYRYRGELARAAAVINEPRRRWRVAGTDLLSRFDGVPVDVFGMKAQEIGGIDDIPQARLHDELARRRVYVHPYRWTSLGLSLMEAMQLGMPVVSLATTAAPEAVPPQAGVVTANPERLVSATRELLADPDRAREAGRAAREAALERFGLARFLADWDSLLEDVSRAR